MDTKRHRGDAYIYQRRTQSALDAENDVGLKSPRDFVPVIHSSKPGEENISPNKSSKMRAEAKAELEARPEEEFDEARPSHKSSSSSEPRRFHFSRPLITPKSLLATGMSTGKRSRINAPATNVFVERGHKRTRTEDVQMKDVESTDASATAAGNEPPRKLKRPGADRKGPAKSAAHLKPAKQDVPPSVEKHWADNMDEITRNMNDFALQVIGENLAKTEERDRKEAAAAAKRQAPSTGSTPQKFKPKPPAKRYSERHPEAVPAGQKAAAVPTADQEDYETASEDEYVVETYVRVPVSSLGQEVDPEKVGLLVFDTEPDAEIFYGEEGDSDDELPEDDEDENGRSLLRAQIRNLSWSNNADDFPAENYYTADYPDDEVDSDDEYDRMAYYYRTGNASDLEEFDERDEDLALGSGDEDADASVPPFARPGFRPPSGFR